MNIFDRLPPRKLCQRLRKFKWMYSTLSNEEIHIPERIERGPTDILKALSGTVVRDPTATHYKYVDDPYFIPISNTHQATYALSRESGKKTAKMIFADYSNLFNHTIAEPKIPAFLPPENYMNKDKVSEESLKKLIHIADIDQALEIYKLLDKNVSTKTKLSMLEMLCFYNNADSNPVKLVDYPAARWYKMNPRNYANTWKSTNEITELFNFLIEQDSDTVAAAYNVMICGMNKYRNASEAYKLYEECLKKEIPIGIDAYNSVLQSIHVLAKVDSKIIDYIRDICSSIIKRKIRPNLVTLNSIISIIDKIMNQRLKEDLMYSVVIDFEKLGIKPSLRTYNLIFCILSKRATERGTTNKETDVILCKLMATAQKKQFSIQDRNDIKAFPEMMKTASEYSLNVVGTILHDLYSYRDNSKFITNRSEENLYYHWYCQLLLTKESPNVFFMLYESLVPHMFVPEPRLFAEIVETFSAYPNFSELYLSRLFPDMALNYLHDLNIVETVLGLVYGYCQRNEPFPLDYTTYFKSIWTHFRRHMNIKKTIRVKILFYLMMFFSHNKDMVHATEILECILMKPYNLWGVLHNNDIKEILTKWPVEDTSISRHIFRYLMLYEVPIDSSVFTKLHTTLNLTPEEVAKLTDLCTIDIVKTDDNKKN